MASATTAASAGATPPRIPPLLVTLALADGLTAAGLSGLGEVLPSLHREWHAGYGALGLALGVLRLACLAGALWIGPRADRLPTRPLLVTALVTIGLAWAAFPVAGGLAPALFIFALLGAATGAHIVLITMVAPRLQVHAPAGATALLSLAFVVGSAAGPVLGTGSMLLTGGAGGLGIALALASLPLVLAYARLPVPHGTVPPASGCREAKGTAAALQDVVVDVGLLAAVLFLLVGVQISFSTWSFTLLGGQGTLAAAVPLVYWLAQAAGAARLALGASLGLRAPTFASVPAAALITAGALLLFALAGSLVVALAVAAVMGWVQGPLFALVAVRAMGLRPAAAGRIGSAIMAANQAGALLLPTVAGLTVAEGRGAAAALLIAASLLMAGLARLAQRAYLRNEAYRADTRAAIARPAHGAELEAALA